jgi:hypothetical protein
MQKSNIHCITVVFTPHYHIYSGYRLPVCGFIVGDTNIYVWLTALKAPLLTYPSQSNIESTKPSSLGYTYKNDKLKSVGRRSLEAP